MNKTAKKTENATPRPWKLNYHRDTDHYALVSPAMGLLIASILKDDSQFKEDFESNVSLIVRAVNSHDALVTALEGLIDAAKGIDDVNLIEAAEEARKALKLAKS